MWQSLDGEILDEEWETLLKYAARVREIAYHASSVCGNGEAFLSNPVIHELHKRNGGRPLFPKLRFLAWHRDLKRGPEDQIAYDRLLDILASPDISAVSFWIPDRFVLGGAGDISDYDPGSDLGTIARRCPLLQEVHLRPNFCPDALLDFSTKIRLRTLKLGMDIVQSNVLDVLGQNLHVEELCGSLSYEFGSLPQQPAALGRLAGGLFPSLRRIHLAGTVVPYLTNLLASVSSPVLTNVTVLGTHDYTSPEDVCLLIKTLSTPHFACSLQTITLSFDFEFMEDYQLQLVPFHFDPFLSPLLSLHNLRHLSLCMSVIIITVTDADVYRMARAWPHAVTIGIGHGRTCRLFRHRTARYVDAPSPGPSVRALVALAERCTKLVDLHCDVARAEEEDECALAELCGARGWRGTRGVWSVKVETDRAHAGRIRERGGVANCLCYRALLHNR